jgi:hypothetical protein
LPPQSPLGSSTLCQPASIGSPPGAPAQPLLPTTFFLPGPALNPKSLRLAPHRGRCSSWRFVAQKADRPDSKADPQIAIREGQERGGILRRKSSAGRRLIALEVDSVKSKQAVRVGKPEISIRGLRQRTNHVWRAFPRPPCGVRKLCDHSNAVRPHPSLSLRKPQRPGMR